LVGRGHSGRGGILAAIEPARRADRRADENSRTRKARVAAMRSFRPLVMVATLVAVAPFLLQAGTSVHAISQQAPDRSAPHRLGTPPALKPPIIEKRTLSNGLPVWVVELHKVP